MASKQPPEGPWLAIIEKEKEAKTGRLDLGQCGLTFIPEEIAEMGWLEELILGNKEFDEADFNGIENIPSHKRIFPEAPENRKITVNDYEANNFRDASLDSLLRLKNLKYLNLNGCSITQFNNLDFEGLLVLILNNNPLSVVGLSFSLGVKIEILGLCNCNLGFKTSENKTLKYASIKFLGISSNNALDLRSLKYFPSIEILLLHNNSKLNTLTGIESLTNLKWLCLNNCSVDNLNALSFLKKLSRLEAKQNNLSNIGGIAILQNISFLDLSYNPLENVTAIQKFQKVKTLEMSSTRLMDFFAFSNYQQLETLSVNNTMATSFKPLEGLQNLRTLYASSSRFQDLGPLMNIKSLETICVSNSYIGDSSQVELLIKSLPKLMHLQLYGNPISNIDQSLFGNAANPNCLGQLKSYFASIKKGSTINNEVKLILVGNSTAGKTTLRKMLLGEDYNAREDSTHGIVTETWTLGKNQLAGISDLDELKVHVWDFGGQEYYHETHRLFFSRHALYVLVWEQETNRHAIIPTEVNELHDGQSKMVEKYIEHQTYEYWLKNIRHYSPESPVILVQNKVDKQWENRTKEEAANPELKKTIFRVSKANDKIINDYNVLEGFDLSLQQVSKNDPDYLHDFQKFERALRKALVEKASYFELGQNYSDIKNQILARRNENKWDYEYYKSFCRQLDPDIEIDHLTEYLADTSVLLHYPNNPGLRNTVFINPVWISDNVYRILNESVLDRSGKFDREHVEKTIGSPELANSFIELMQQFQIIFEIRKKQTAVDGPKYVAPQYLPEGYTTRSYYLFKNQCGKPKFTLRFPKFLPKTIMNGLLSNYAGRSLDESYFRYGVAFEEGATNSYVNIIESDYDNSEINVYSGSNDIQNMRTIFENILLMFNIDITEKPATVQGTTAAEPVIPDSTVIHVSIDGQNFINWNDLFKQRKTIADDTALLPVQGVQLKAETFKLFYISRGDLQSYISLRRELVEPPRIFISYSHKDELYKNELSEHMSGLINEGLIKEWNDRAIRPGEKWDEAIKKNLDEADIILFLVSSSFMASQYINNVEIKDAMKRHNDGKVLIIPVHIRPCDFRSLPLKGLQKIPRDHSVVDTAKFPTRDFAWDNVVIELKEEIKKLQQKKPAV